MRCGRQKWIATWQTHSLADLNALFVNHGVMPLALNSIEFIAFRGSEYAQIQARLHELGKIAQAIGCPTVVVVPSPSPDRNMPWADIVAEYVKVLRDLSDIAQPVQHQTVVRVPGLWVVQRAHAARCIRDHPKSGTRQHRPDG